MSQSEGRADIAISVLIGDFDDATYQVAVEQLREHFSVTANKAIELTEISVAHVVLEMAMSTLQALPAELVGSYLYDGLRPLLRPREAAKSFFEFKVEENPEGTRYVYANLETADEEILREAMATFKDLARTENVGKSFEFDSVDTRRWEEHRQNE